MVKSNSSEGPSSPTSPASLERLSVASTASTAMLFLQVRIIPQPQKKAVPAIDTVLADTANQCWTVIGGLLSFGAIEDY